jgi:thioesterase domain-containing protein
MLEYVPHPYAGRIVFFRAQEAWEYEPPVRPEHVWLDIASGGIDVYTVPGNHITMNQQPHVQAIAERLEHYFKQVVVGAK